MTDQDPLQHPAGLPPPAGTPRRRRIGGRALAAALVVGGIALGAGATGLTLSGRQTMVIATNPVPIATLQAWTPVAVKGEVAEVFGNAFVVQDQSGRALVDTGPAGEGTPLVAKDETVTIQGRLERGILRAAAVSHADGRTDMTGPPGPPRPPLAWLDRHGLHWHWLRASGDAGPARA